MNKSKASDPYGLKLPCANCPFLKDASKSIRKHLKPGRVTDIITGLVTGRDTGFSCHKTTGRGTEDDEGNYVPSGQEMECAGAVILLEKMGRPTQTMRIMEAIGGYDPEDFDLGFHLVIDPKDLGEI